MKNSVFIFCAVITLFSFSSCKECLECSLSYSKCGRCIGAGTSNIVCRDTSSSVTIDPYAEAEADCKANAGQWSVTEQGVDVKEVCENSSSKTQNSSLPLVTLGYSCSEK